ncbi:MAG: zinc metalloprotease, partial [Bacteroidota bacterium]|nr:zinc metalloprotease [Bacteroidota bacterium]
ENNTEAAMRTASTNDPGTGSQRRCAAHDVLLRQIAADPERGRRLETLERIIDQRSATLKGKPPGSGGGTPLGSLITIPVVVHVVLPDPTKVSDQQINSQLAVLNNDFQKANAELKNGVYLSGYQLGEVANCQIAFTLQQTVRKTTTVASFSSNDAVKFTSQGGSDAVNATSALNLWVCDLGSGLLGYAQFPGGSASTDGVVVDYQAFGTSASYTMYKEYNKGRTATHEIGHWLNLRHIWGDTRCGNDYVDDTPLHDGPNYGCPASTDQSFCKGTANPDMWMNYMDYTDDACMYMFTAKQKERIDLTLANARSGYYTTAKVTQN